MLQPIILALCAVLLAGCTNAEKSSNAGETQLRVIAAAAGAAEIMSEIGLGDSIVGVDERNTNASDAELVTSGHSFNFEKLISLQPTHLILDSLTDSSEVRKQLEQIRVEVIELPTAESITGIYNKYQILGEKFNRSTEAQSASAELQSKFDDLKITTRSFRIAFLYLRGTNAIFFVGGKGSGADSLISAVGSVDVGAQNLTNPFSPLTAEVMRQLNPDVLLLMREGYESVGGLEGLKSLPGLSGTDAVKRGNIVLIDDRELLNFGPQTINVLRQIQEQLSGFDAA